MTIPQPLVSVITIFLDEGRFIQDAIDSVFAQTYENWELLLVDDGSTDRSSLIARDHAQRFPGRVRYIEHPAHANRGMSASRNLGIHASNGVFIAFLDADDVWEPDKLRDQIALFKAYPTSGMVCGASVYWRSWSGDRKGRGDKVVVPGAPADTLVSPPDLATLLYPLGDGAAPSMSGLMVRREVLTAIGGFESQFRGMYEDQALLVKIYLRFPVFVASSCWDRYRQHPDSCVAQAHNTGRYDEYRAAFLVWLERYLAEEGMRDTRLWRRLQIQLRPYRRGLFHRIRYLWWGLGQGREA